MSERVKTYWVTDRYKGRLGVVEIEGEKTAKQIRLNPSTGNVVGRYQYATNIPLTAWNGEHNPWINYTAEDALLHYRRILVNEIKSAESDLNSLRNSLNEIEELLSV